MYVKASTRLYQAYYYNIVIVFYNHAFITRLATLCYSLFMLPYS
jgi:hypothetical protein